MKIIKNIPTSKEIKEVTKIMQEVVKNISENKMKILDDFCTAYLASRWDDYFKKKGKIEIGRVELVEKREKNKIIYFFRLKKGRLKK